MENAFDILDKDEIGKTAAKFEKIKTEFKQQQYEQLHRDFKDNDDVFKKPEVPTDAFEEMKREFERLRNQDEDREKKKGLER